MQAKAVVVSMVGCRVLKEQRRAEKRSAGCVDEHCRPPHLERGKELAKWLNAQSALDLDL